MVDTKGNTISDIDITLDGTKVATSDANGTYHLSNIRPGTYSLEATHEHIFFESILNLKVSIWLDNLPDLTLSHLHLCGQINFNFGGTVAERELAGFTYNDVKIILQHKTYGKE